MWSARWKHTGLAVHGGTMSEPERQVALIGMMGTGKTTVGALLAAELGYDFVDLDAVLAERAGLSIPEIFAREGESGFRRRERKLLLEINGRRRQVLSTGGGIVLDPANTATLRAGGLVVALIASVEAIVARVGGGCGRPLLAVADPAAAVTRLARARDGLYRAAADLVLETTSLAPAEAALALARWCRTHPGLRKP